MSLLGNSVEWTSVGVTFPCTSLVIIEKGSVETTDFTCRDSARWSCCFALLSLQDMFQTKPRWAICWKTKRCESGGMHVDFYAKDFFQILFWLLFVFSSNFSVFSVSQLLCTWQRTVEYNSRNIYLIFCPMKMSLEKWCGPGAEDTGLVSNRNSDLPAFKSSSSPDHFQITFSAFFSLYIVSKIAWKSFLIVFQNEKCSIYIWKY